jgi:hypothetical protein
MDSIREKFYSYLVGTKLIRVDGDERIVITFYGSFLVLVISSMALTT